MIATLSLQVALASEALRKGKRRPWRQGYDEICYGRSTRRTSTAGGAMRISLKACIQLLVASTVEPTPRLRNWSS
jgi:hypothetical protein